MRCIVMFAAIGASFLGSYQKLYAIDIATGITTVDDGDDRIRPGALLHLGLGQSFYTRYFVYGRKFGPVTERTSLVSFNYAFPLYSQSRWHAGVGAAFLQESTKIEALAETDEAVDENNYNAGASFGLFWMPNTTRFFFEAGWESHLFLAGQAGLFLSTGRKEMLSLAVGFRL